MASTSFTHQCPTSSDSDDFTPEERYVAQILLELQSESSLVLPPSWPIRRKRSAVDSPPESTSVNRQLSIPPPPPPSSPETVKESSPTTPLSLNSFPLSRSESDENNTNHKVSKKKAALDKKSHYLETIDKLTHQNQALEGDVEAMKQQYIHLKTMNSKLKAKKQEIVLDGSSNQSENREIGSSRSVAMKMAKLSMKSSPATNPENNVHQCETSMKNQTAPMAEQSNNSNQNLQIPIGLIPVYDNPWGPMGIPDLNLSFQEFSERSYSKYLAAKARQNRIQICKNKNNGASKFQP